MPRDPVVLAEIRSHQDTEPFEHLIAHAVSVVFVDRRQAIHVKEDQRNWQPVAACAIDFLCQHGLEKLRACAEWSGGRSSRRPRDRAASARCSRPAVERRPPDELRDVGHASLVAPMVSLRASSSSAVRSIRYTKANSCSADSDRSRTILWRSPTRPPRASSHPSRTENASSWVSRRPIW